MSTTSTASLLKRANRLSVFSAPPIATQRSIRTRIDSTSCDATSARCRSAVVFTTALAPNLPAFEAEITIATLLRRLPNLQLDDIEHPDWRQTFVLRGLN